MALACSASTSGGFAALRFGRAMARRERSAAGPPYCSLSQSFARQKSTSRQIRTNAATSPVHPQPWHLKILSSTIVNDGFASSWGKVGQCHQSPVVPARPTGSPSSSFATARMSYASRS